MYKKHKGGNAALMLRFPVVSGNLFFIRGRQICEYNPI